jgi:TolB-like protein/DNA-binding winged helix-turn-helix (wHTH) protein
MNVKRHFGRIVHTVLDLGRTLKNRHVADNGKFRLGGWLVEPALNRISQGQKRVHLRPRVMDVLVYLAHHRGEVTSADELLEHVWAGRVVTSASIYAALNHLREALGDDAQQPQYIRTIPRRGYRLIADVEFATAPQQEPLPRDLMPAAGAAAHERPRKIRLWADFIVPSRYRSLVLAASLIALVATVLSTHEKMGVNGTAPVLSRPSLAVLPFVDLSEDQEGFQFSDGMHSELLTKLGRLEAIKVIARNSVLAYRGTSKDPRTIGEELDVKTIMAGEVQRSGNRLHVNIQLVDTKTNEHIWAETYDRELTATNMFAIQSEIANEVANTLRVELSPQQQTLLADQPTTNTAAYEAYLMGQHLMAKRTTAEVAESVRYFQEAIALDAEYALAYVGLADAYIILEWYGDQPSTNLMAKSRAAIDRALELDGELGEAYASLGSLVFADYEQSEAAYRRSIELSPNHATAHHWYGTLLRLNGRFEEAGQQFEKARELNPLSAIINAEIGTYLEELGRFDASRKQLQKVVSIDPGFRDIYRDLAALAGTAYGRIDDSLAILQKELSTPGAKALEDPGSLAWLYVNVANAYMQIGGDDQASFWIATALDLVPEHVGALFARQELRLLQGGDYQGGDYAWDALEQARILEVYNVLPLLDAVRLFEYHEIRNGRGANYREDYEQKYPEFRQTDTPGVTKQNFRAAINLALILARTGEKERSEQFLESCLDEFENMPRLGRYGYQIADVMIYAVQGKKTEALTALRTAIDDGWRYRARYLLEFEPNLLSLHAEPAYQAMAAEVKADLADQYERVAELERRGHL